MIRSQCVHILFGDEAVIRQQNGQRPGEVKMRSDVVLTRSGVLKCSSGKKGALYLLGTQCLSQLNLHITEADRQFSYISQCGNVAPSLNCQNDEAFAVP